MVVDPLSYYCYLHDLKDSHMWKNHIQDSLFGNESRKESGCICLAAIENKEKRG